MGGVLLKPLEVVMVKFLAMLGIVFLTYWLFIWGFFSQAWFVFAANDPIGAMQTVQNPLWAFYNGVAPYAQRLLTLFIGIIVGYVFARLIDLFRWAFRTHNAGAGAR